MLRKTRWSLAAILALGLLSIFVVVRLSARAASVTSGLFPSHGDVGTVLHAGSVTYDAASKTYTVTGSGENMWLASDAFQFAWTRVSGDAALTADISFLGTGGNAHRKAVLMIRQSLDADSPYADVALHGSGLTSLQFREEKGAATHEVQANVNAPARLRIQKRGGYFQIYVGAGNQLQLAAGSPRIPIKAPYYVGIGVCSHDKDAVERAVFRNVDLETSSAHVPARPALYSTLEVVPIDSADRRAVYVTAGRIEAPNWTHDGRWFIFNRNGRIERLPAEGGQPEVIDTGLATDCNNDHVLSPDGKFLAISDMSQEDHESLIYIVPLAGGAARRITRNSPSYCHGWSPDGKTLAFCGDRKGNFDVYTIPAAGGEETRLTTAEGLDDGPEYSPDGQYIYFNSVRTGLMQIWRMRTDGSNQEQVTADELNNWFAHISPDGKWMVFLTYKKDVTGHPEGQDVMLRLMRLDGQNKVTVLARLYGGQGTINVPSWSPDSQRVAFVSYHRVW